MRQELLVKRNATLYGRTKVLDAVMHTYVDCALTLFLVAVFAMTSIFAGTVQDDERRALTALFNATGGPQWARRSTATTDWAVSNETADYCRWTGVTCEAVAGVGGGMVVKKLTLPSRRLRGSLRANIFSLLQHIEELSLASNAISGALPPDLAGCTFLRIVDLSHNQFTGELPSGYHSWRRIESFAVANNSLSGELPAGYASWGNAMFFFDVSSNALTGTLPGDYVRWAGMRVFSVHRNMLDGTLPAVYSQWKIEAFNAGWNRLSGVLPDKYGDWGRSLVNFSAARNANLTGTLPNSYSAWTNIMGLEVHQIPVFGTLPAAYGVAWKRVMYVLIYLTNISGTIPQEWGGLVSVYSLQLAGNKLSGTIPASFGNFTNLNSLNLGVNNFSGTLPVESFGKFRNIYSLLLQDNPLLSGTIPASWNTIFTPSAMVAICRTNLCAPMLAALFPFGYGCLPRDKFGLMTSLDTGTASGLAELISAASFTLTADNCVANPGAQVPLPEKPTTRTSSHTATSGPGASGYLPTILRSVTTLSAASVVVLLQHVLFAGVLPSSTSGALHTMQAALILQRVRQLCLMSATSSEEVMNRGVLSMSEVIQESDICCDAATSPTQMRIAFGPEEDGDGGRGLFTGAVLGNSLLVVGIAFVRAAARHLIRRCRLVEPGATDIVKTISGVYFSASGVALVWPVVTFLLCPTMVAAVAALASAGSMPSTAGVVAVSSFGVLLWMSPWAAAFWGLRRHRAWMQPSISSNRNIHQCTSLSFSSFRDYLTAPSEILVLPRGERGERILEQYGPVFSPFRATKLWYVHVELTFSVVSGILTGIALGTSLVNANDAEDAVAAICSDGVVNAVGWLLVATACLETFIVVTLRPYSCRADTLLVVVVNTFSIAAEIVTLATVTDDGQAAANALSLTASIIQFTASLLLAVDVIVTKRLGARATVVVSADASERFSPKTHSTSRALLRAPDAQVPDAPPTSNVQVTLLTSPIEALALLLDTICANRREHLLSTEVSM